MRLSAIVVTLFVISISNSFEFEWNPTSFDQEWHQFKEKYHKSYPNPTEELYRKNIFFKNVKKIAEHNENFKKNLETYEQDVNQFADMEFNEISILLGIDSESENLKKFRNTKISYKPFNLRSEIPDSINWSEKGAVTAVKQQGAGCGSCYAFSSLGSIEGQYFKKHKKLIELSPQQLVDCSKPFGNKGCKKGHLRASFKYIMKNGVEREEDYPHSGTLEKCKFNETKTVTKIVNYVELPKGDEKVLMEAVADIGPISACMEITDNFQFFKGKSIFYDKLCSKEVTYNHGVLIVGYGTENGTDYWLVKNSFGENFGDNGYIRIARNQDNHCNIATLAMYPIL